jgi:hypothetical protein
VCHGADRRDSVEQSQIRQSVSLLSLFSSTGIGPRLFVPEVHLNIKTRNASERIPAFFQHLSEYSTRELSNEADMLKAFKGMLAQSPRYSHWGIPAITMQRHCPIQTDAEAFNFGFALGLCWKPLREDSSMRPGFPTCSWTCAKNGVVHNI